MVLMIVTVSEVLKKVYTPVFKVYNLSKFKACAPLRHVCSRTITSQPEPTSKVSSIVESLKSKSNKDFSLKRDLKINNLSKIAQYLLSQNISENEIVKLFANQPNLSSTTSNIWRINFQLFIDNGFSVSETFSIFKICPNILTYSSDEIIDKIENVRKLGLEGKTTHLLIKHVPQVCLMDEKILYRRLQLLKKYFPLNDMPQLIEKSPAAFFDDWDKIESKIYYIRYEMGLDQRHVMRSGALNHSWKYISLRHMFLKRAGIYKTPNQRDPVQIKTNPKLDEILNTSVSKFINKVVSNKISEEEYYAFKEVFSLELEKNSAASDTSDDETDSDTDIDETDK